MRKLVPFTLGSAEIRVEPERGLTRIVAALMVSALGLLALVAIAGCRAPDQALLEADAAYHDTIGAEYRAHIREIVPRFSPDGVSLTADEIEDEVALREGLMRAWDLFVAEARSETSTAAPAGGSPR